MKNFFLVLFCILYFNMVAQINHQINKTLGPVSNDISGIDSIVFDGAGKKLELLLNGGVRVSHAFSDIVDVTFNPLLISSATCGASNVHNSGLIYGIVSDHEGNDYRTIKIGNQVWMAENLRMLTYRNGDSLARVSSNTNWTNMMIGGVCAYKNDENNVCPYGRLYNWYAVGDPRGLCPAGWHMPSEGEWNTLINHLDPTANGGNNFNNIAGGKLKNAGLQYWLSPNLSADNSSGFSALPAGARGSTGVFNQLNQNAYWWNATEGSATGASYRTLDASSGSITGGFFVKRGGYSVRCIKD